MKKSIMKWCLWGIFLILLASTGQRSFAQSSNLPSTLTKPFTYSYTVTTHRDFDPNRLAKAQKRIPKLVAKGLLTKEQGAEAIEYEEGWAKNFKSDRTYSAFVSYDGKSLLAQRDFGTDKGTSMCIYDGKRTYLFSSVTGKDQFLIVEKGLEYSQFADIILPGVGIPLIPFKAIDQPGSDESTTRLLVPLPGGSITYLPADVVLVKQGNNTVVEEITTDVKNTFLATWKYSDMAAIGDVAIARHLIFDTYSVGSNKERKLESHRVVTITDFKNEPLPPEKFKPTHYLKANDTVQNGLNGKIGVNVEHAGYENVDQIFEDRELLARLPSRKNKKSPQGGIFLLVALSMAVLGGGFWYLSRRSGKS